LQLVASANEASGIGYTSKGAIPASGGTVAQSNIYTHYSGDAAAYILKLDLQRGGVVYEWIVDSDADSLSDLIEIRLKSNLYASYSDNDGLTDADEYLIHGTSLTHADTDHDGSIDSDEVVAGTSPLDSDSRFVASLQPADDGQLNFRWYGSSVAAIESSRRSRHRAHGLIFWF
jgi:hypothetical protein